MRLLLVTHYMPPHHGGIERIAEDHALTAAAAGHQVTWIASRSPRPAAARETRPWGEALRIRCVNVLESRLGVPYPLWAPLAWRAVNRAVAGSDLVHVHDVLYPGTGLALRAARRHGVPALLTQHVGEVPYRSRLLMLAQRVAYRTRGRVNAGRATQVATYNARVAAFVRTVLGVKGEVLDLPNGVDLERFRPARDAAERAALRQRFRVPVDRPLVLFVGRLVAKKGADLVVGAAQPGYHTLLLGERGEVTVPACSHLELRGFVAREELAALLRCADVLALPSRGEGFPLVVQEAMASGLAVVVGDDEGYGGHVDEGALVRIEPRVEALRAAVRELVGEARLRERVGAAARASAARHWDQAACRARLLEVYGRLARLLPGGPKTEPPGSLSNDGP